MGIEPGIMIQDTLTTVIDCDVNEAKVLTFISFCNTSLLSGEIINIYGVASGEVAATQNMLANALDIPSGETFQYNAERMPMKDGDSIKVVGIYGDIVAAVPFTMEI